MARWLAKGKHWFLMFVFLFVASLGVVSEGAELPLVRIAHGAFNEKIAVLWIGVEQGFFRKHGVEVEVEDVVDEVPVQRVEKTDFYRDLVARAKR